MKIPKELWFQIIDFVNEKENENNHKNYVIKFLNELKINDFDSYLGDQITYDIILDMSINLENINSEKNELIKDSFFKYYKDINFDEKKRIFRNVDNNIFNKEFKSYFIKNMIKYPDVECLFYFKKYLSPEILQDGLKNLFNQTKFNCIKNQNYNDYWENNLESKNIKKLLDLLDIANLTKEDLTKFNKIGFINDYNQLRFDKLLKSEKLNNKNFIETKEETMYSIEINMNKLVLSNEKGTTGRNNDEIFEFIKTIIITSSELEEWKKTKKIENSFYLISNDIEKFNCAKKIDFIKENILDYFDIISNEVKEIKNKVLIPDEVKKKAGEIGRKILLKCNLEENLLTTNKKQIK